MLTPELQATLRRAIELAYGRRHEFVTLEHLLAAMLDDPRAAEILKACGADLAELRSDTEGFLAEHMEELPEGEDRQPHQTLAFRRVLDLAAAHMRSSGRDALDSGAVLVAMFHEDDSHAIWLLQSQGVERFDLINYVSHGISKAGESFENIRSGPSGVSEDAATPTAQDPLAAYCTDLVERARDGRIDPLIGRAVEIERCVQVLCRRRKNNPVLVGEPGVGKTAIAEGLALRIADGDVPERLAEARIYSLDMSAVLAGTRYRGDFEERFKALLAAITEDDDAILFIDEIHTIVGAGATSGGTMDASNMLKPALASGELRCIGSTTYAEFKSAFGRDRALARRFQKIDVVEPSADESYRILRGLKERYEQHHGLRYTDAALRAAAELSSRHIIDQMLPDKAIDVIDEAGARMSLRGRKSVRPKDIEQVVARIARIPTRTVSTSDRDKLARLEDDLRGRIYGQDPAVEQVATAIKLSRSGLRPPDKPVGSFLFTGPTGVGKTELARQLADVLGIEFLRFDMSEYMEKHSVSRLIGAPPGYVGYDQGGLLTDAIIKNPHSLLVLDEIEKAHPDLFNILLQVMDHATLTDNNGRKADFRSVILIMTTNVGAREMAARGLGFGESQKHLGSNKALERKFSPEFRNRLDSTITFAPLEAAAIAWVVDKFLGELDGQLVPRQVVLKVTDEARAWVAKKGYDQTFGARPLARVIHEHIKRPLADELLFGRLADGGQVTVDVDGDGLALTFGEDD